MPETFKPNDLVEKELAEQLVKDGNHDLLIKTMSESFSKQDDPMVGSFWYDPIKKELYGVSSTLAEDVPFYKSNQFNDEVKTGRQLHEKIWQKEFYRKKDNRFSGDYTQKPRGRVFEFKDKGFVVFTGEWINKYPEVKKLVIEEFQLPKDKTEFRIDSHWDLGHGWSQEF